MSIRNKPAYLTDRFDSRSLGTFNDVPLKNNPPVETVIKQSVPSLTFGQAMDVLTILLRDYQSKHFQAVENDPFHQWFPFAWIPLQIGDEIKNLDTQEVYRVDETIEGHEKYKYNLVRLRGKNPPKKFEMLRLDDKKSKFVDIKPAFPDAELKPYEFTAQGYVQSGEDEEKDIPAWIDTITYTMEDEQPGSLEGRMFQTGTRDVRPRHREDIDGSEIYTQFIDNRVRMDFWTLSNKGSEIFREWFRDFINKYTWLIEANGLDHFHWTKSYTAERATRWRKGMIHRSALYDFRTSYSFSKNLFKIREFDVSVQIPRSLDDKQFQGDIISTTLTS